MKRAVTASILVLFCLLIVPTAWAADEWTGTYVYWTGSGAGNWSSGTNWEHYYFGEYRDYGTHPQNDDMIYFQAGHGATGWSNTNIDYAGQEIYRLLLWVDNVGIYGNQFALYDSVELDAGLHATIGTGIALKTTYPIWAGGPSFRAGSGAVLTLSGIVSGSQDLHFGGEGTLRLQGNNTYTGITSNWGGVIEIATNSNLGAVSSGLRLGSSSSGSWGTLRYTTGTTTIARPIETLGTGDGGACIDLPDADTVLTWSGAITGNGGLKKTGAGKLKLTGANTFTSPITIEEGTLNVGSTGSLGSPSSIKIRGGGTFQNQGTINYTGEYDSIYIGTGGGTISTLGNLTVTGIWAEGGAVNPTLIKADSSTLETHGLGVPTTINNGTLRYTGHTLGVNIINGSILDLAPDASMTYNGTISGAGLLRKSGLQTVTFTGTRTGTGQTEVTGGFLTVSADSKLGTAPGSYVANQLELDGGGLKTTASFTLAANRGITLGAGHGTLTVDPSTTLTVGGIIAGAGNLTKNGTGTLLLNANNTFTGDLHITQGTVRCGSVNALTDSTVVTADLNTTLDLNGTNQWFGGIAGAGSILLGAGELKTQRSLDTEFSGIISGTNGRLVKDGTQTLTLSGANTYTGLTRISNGTLRLEGGSAISNNGSVTLDNTAGVKLELGADEEISQLSGGGINGGEVYLWGHRLTLGSSGINTTFGGTFADAGTLTKTGSGTFTLTGYCNFTGATISQGALKSSAGVLSGEITNNATLEFNQASDGTFYNVISGTGTLVKTGWGQLTLNAANTYTGPTNINEGMLRVLGGNAIHNSSPVTIANTSFTGLKLGASEEIGSLAGGGDLDLSSYVLTVGGNNQSTTYNGMIYGTGGQLVKKGTGTLDLTYSCSYTGGTTVQAGTLKGDVISLQGNITNNATVEFNQTGAGTYFGVMSGTGALVKTGSAMLTLEGDNTYTGETHIQAGILRLGTGNILGQTTVRVDAGTTLDLYNTDENFGALVGEGNVTLGTGNLGVFKEGDYVFSGVISGTGGLTKEGSGIFEILGANTYSGGTTVIKGTLKGNADSVQGGITNNASVVFNQATAGTYAGNMSGTGSLTKQNSGTLILTGSNTYSGGTTISAGILQVGNGGTTGSISGNITDSANLTFNRSNSYTFSGTISGGGSVTQIGAGTTTLTGVNTYTGGTTVTAGSLGIGSDGNLGGTSGSLTLNGGTLKSTAAFSFSSARSIILGINDGTFDTNGFTLTIPSVISGTGSLTKAGLAGLILTGSDTYSGGTTISAGTLQIGNGGTVGSIGGNITDSANLTFNRSNNYTFSGIISGSGSVTQAGTGTLTLTATNTYSGGTTVSAGTLSIGADSALGSTSGPLTLDGGILQTTNTLSLSSLRSIVLGDNDGRFDTNGFNTTVPSVISGTGSLTKAGLASLILTGADTYSGGTTISAGTLQIGNGGTTGSIGGNVTDSGILTFNRSNAYTFDGIISGSGSVTKAGSGTLILTGANTYAGGTTVSTGVLQGNTTSLQGDIANSASVTFDQTASGIYDDIISGIGTLTKSGAGTLTLTGANTYSGGTTISTGMLQVGNGGTIGSIGGNVTDSANLTFNRSNSYTFSGIISGSGSVTQAGTGTLTLTGVNTYSGGTSLNAGIVEVGSNGNLGSASGSLAMNTGTLRATNTFSLSSGRNVTLNAGGGTFDTNGFNLSIDGAVSGTGNLTKIGAGTLSLNAINTYSGKTIVNGGTTQVSSILRFGTDPGTYVADRFTLNGGTLKTTASTSFAANRGITLGAAGGTFEPAASSVLTVNSPIVGSGGLTMGGAGTLTLVTPCTFTGPTAINQGAVMLSGNAIFPTTMTVNIASPATLNMTNRTQTLAGLTGEGQVLLGTGTLTLTNTTNRIFSGILSGAGGNLTKNGSAVYTLEGANSYTGLTAINQGTIRLGNHNRLADASSMSISTGAFFDLNGFNEAIDELTGLGSVLLNGGTLTVGADDGSSAFLGGISGNGGLTKTGTGTLSLTCVNTYQGPTTVAAGTLSIGSITSIPAASSVSLALGSKLLFSTPIGSNWSFTSPVGGSGELEKTGTGTLVLAANANYSGLTTVTQGTLRIDDTLQTSGQAIMLNSNATLEASGVIRRDVMGSGTLVLTDTLVAGSLTGAGVNLSNGSVRIGTYELALLSRYEAMIGGGTIAGGTLSSLHGVTLTNNFSGYGTVDGDFTNQGLVTGGTGSDFLRFYGPVDGAGSFAGNIKFYNIYSPGNSPAAVGFENLALTDSSLLKMELSGLIAGNEYDQLNISGQANLGGTLDISLLNGFMPAKGDLFRILNFGSKIGAFEAVLGWNFGNGLFLDPIYNGTNLTLVTLHARGGDASCDKKVDVSDLGILAANYGKQSGATWSTGDFNGDGKVDVSDLGILAANYGSVGTEVPEPATLLLLVLGGWAVCRLDYTRSSRSLNRSRSSISSEMGL